MNFKMIYRRKGSLTIFLALAMLTFLTFSLALVEGTRNYYFRVEGEQAMELAEYLTNEKSQARRFEVLGYGPSNINVASSDAVASDPALKALAEQSKYAISQHVNGAYWTPAEAFGAEVKWHGNGRVVLITE